jgi:Ca2+-binding RTX toxin-like protein
VFGNAGDDVIYGLAGDDTLYGDFGPDPFEMRHFMPGQEGFEAQSVPGNDVLIGGLGRDLMTGGGGHDSFQFDRIQETGKTAATRDVITDFKVGDDIIDLSQIDAKPSTAADDAFSWIGTSAFTGSAGQLHYVSQHGATIVEGDIDGDRHADFQIELTGRIILSALDFHL